MPSIQFEHSMNKKSFHFDPISALKKVTMGILSYRLSYLAKLLLLWTEYGEAENGSIWEYFPKVKLLYKTAKFQFSNYLWKKNTEFWLPTTNPNTRFDVVPFLSEMENLKWQTTITFIITVFSN